MSEPAGLGPASPVGELPLVPPVWVTGDDTARDVAALMCAERVAVVLVDTHNPAILTEHDLVQALTTADGPATPVGKLATPDPYAAWEHEPVLDAARRMLVNCIRHLVIIRRDGTIAGVLTLGQATEALVAGVHTNAWAVSLQSTTVSSTVRLRASQTD